VLDDLVPSPILRLAKDPALMDDVIEGLEGLGDRLKAEEPEDWE